MIRKIGCTLALVTVCTLALVMPAQAGGWATVEIEQLPGEIRAGETVHLEFVVLQHGKTPVHRVLDTDVRPELTARNAATSEELRVPAQKLKSPGHFMLDVVFPSEGQWEWQILTEPLVSATKLAPLSVLAAPAKAPASEVEPLKFLEPAQVKVPSSELQPAETEDSELATGGLSLRPEITIAGLTLAGAGLLALVAWRRRKLPALSSGN